MSDTAVLPETAAVYWRPRMDEQRLRLRGRLWTLTTVAHTVPFLAVGALLLALNPISAPVAVVALVHAWMIPELYAKRGSNVLRPVRKRGAAVAEQTAAGLLGDLVGHGARELYADTGLVTERGRFGIWVVGEQGAVLVRSRGRRADCFCVRVNDAGLPGGDRVAHLLLALREDEAGFATVANLAFSGAPWRIRRRLPDSLRPAVAAAQAASRGV